MQRDVCPTRTLHQLQQTIAPKLRLGFVLPHWKESAAALAEHNRERVPQLATYQRLS